VAEGKAAHDCGRDTVVGWAREVTEAILLKDFPINLSALTNSACMELTPRRSRQARNWKGQEQHWELRGNVYFKQ
jgi:hypothetical protein